MNESILWLHEDALRRDHPVFQAAPPGCDAIFVWDDAYFHQMDYSLKRLVFLYECLCELPIEILRGETAGVLGDHDATHIHMASTLNPLLLEIADQVGTRKKITIIAEEPFVTLAPEDDYARFAQYWKRGKQTAFLENGGRDNA